MDQYYTAAEAARILGLNYHTFMYRVRKGRYDHDRVGWSKVFDKNYIDGIAGNASGNTNLEETTGKVLCNMHKERDEEVGDRVVLEGRV